MMTHGVEQPTRPLSNISVIGQFVISVMFNLTLKGAGLLEKIDVFLAEAFDAM